MMDAFTEDEKRFVLAEYIKASHVKVEQLVDFIRSYDLDADWLSMQLPGGRNMNQCMRAAESLLNVQIPPPNLSTKRKSMGDLNEPPPKRIASMTPIEYQPHLQAHPSPMASMRTVNIQPRPPPSAGTPSNGYNVFHSNPSPAPTSLPATRKRGRPSKADKEAQMRANANGQQPAGYPQLAPVPISPAPLPPPVSSAPTVPSAHPGPSPLHSSPPAYHIAPGPVDTQPHRGRQPSAADKAQPRGLVENPFRSPRAENSPSIGNLVTPEPAPEPRNSPTMSRPDGRPPAAKPAG